MKLETGYLSSGDPRWDLVSLGEVMLRLDPGEGRISTARSFRVWEGGGEYNVARALRRSFGLHTALLSAFVDNPIGRLLDGLVLEGGVDTSHVRWLSFDGVGHAARNGINFTERGFGVRSALACSDRGHSAASQMGPGDVDYSRLFGAEGARWFHTGGIFAGLSTSTALLAEETMEAAHMSGAVVSFDVNYRPSLWAERGGQAAAIALNRRLVRLADVLFGNEEDFSVGLGFDGIADLANIDAQASKTVMAEIARQYPQLELIAASLRRVRSANRNDWGGVCWAAGELVRSEGMRDIDILDRVGGGDAFAAGVIYGLLKGISVHEALQHGIAHGALVMTTPGDTSMATLAEVEHVIKGGSPRVVR